MKDKIKLWFEKTGYPLELFVHKVAHEKGYLCEKSPFYTDPETEISREIDLIAYKHGNLSDKYSFEINLIIECKKAEKPLIILCEGGKTERYVSLLGIETISQPYVNSGLAFLYLSELSREDRKREIGGFSDQVLNGYSIVSGFEKSDQNVYKGIKSIAKAHDFFKESYLKTVALSKEDNNRESEWLRLQIPIVVIDAPLFTANLDDKGELNIEETLWSSLTIRRSWVIDEFGTDGECNIQIVSKDYFPKFIEHVEKLHQSISKEEAVFYLG